MSMITELVERLRESADNTELDMECSLACDGECNKLLREAADVIEELSAKSERKSGKWIDGKCNRCGTHAPFWEMATTYYCSEYCPKCGAKMEVEE